MIFTRWPRLSPCLVTNASRRRRFSWAATSRLASASSRWICANFACVYASASGVSGPGSRRNRRRPRSPTAATTASNGWTSVSASIPTRTAILPRTSSRTACTICCTSCSKSTRTTASPPRKP
uniref:(northern house mosquito) hypothetical protein n=1 Tax=Culex pipiens TaxID=7175 RepID=A0A8D8GIN1_CULPI